jgi:hypothetical protein
MPRLTKNTRQYAEFHRLHIEEIGQLLARARALAVTASDNLPEPDELTAELQITEHLQAVVSVAGTFADLDANLANLANLDTGCPRGRFPGRG